MNRVAAQEFAAAQAVLTPAGGSPGFVTVVAAVAAVIAWCVAWYWPTATEIALIWWRSDTFAHGMIVLPVFGWLIYSKRGQIGGLTPCPVPWLALPAAAAGSLWLLGSLVSVAAAAHAGLVSMLIIGLVAMLGWRLSRVLMFPLAFLLFAIPVGEFLMPALMKLTAEFTVWALRVSGVPVYQEGLHFVIPNGRWSVVEACSGIRYLIASTMVGSLFAYLNYVSLHKRLIFMGVAVLVSIVANWLRAYMIVMLGYLSNNEIAAGVDHLIYGWVFFGLVIALIFWIGRRWSEEVEPPMPVVTPESLGRPRWLAFAPVAIVIAVFPSIFASMDAPAEPFELAYDLPAPAAGWTAQEVPESAYRPHYTGARGEAVGVYRDGTGADVMMYSALFAAQGEGAEMVTWENGLIPPDSNLLNVVVGRGLDTSLGHLRSADLIGRTARLTVAHWYVVNGHVLTRDWEVKLRLAADRLLGRPDTSMVFVLAAPAIEPDEGAARIRAFLDAHSDALWQSIAAAESKVPQ